MNPRDIIFTELINTYASFKTGNETWFSKESRLDIYRALTTEILSRMVSVLIGDKDLNLFDEVHLTTWNWMPGGGTAEICANNIFEKLGLPKGE